MPHVTVDGLDFWADVEGSGPPVVLIHGFTGSRTTWYDLVQAASKEFTTIAIDHIGHGRTASPPTVDRYRMERTVDDLVEVQVIPASEGHLADTRPELAVAEWFGATTQLVVGKTPVPKVDQLAYGDGVGVLTEHVGDDRRPRSTKTG